MFSNYGISVELILNDFSKRMMTISQAEELKKRITEKQYIYSDIDRYILNSNDFKNVIFCIDYKAIEVLANSGIPEYQETMMSILKTMLRHSYDKDEKLKVERSRWKRRVYELKESLSVKEK